MLYNKSTREVLRLSVMFTKVSDVFCTMDPSFEVRKLPSSVVKELVHTVEYAEHWKRLMSIVPRTLEKDNYECKITKHNPPKYRYEHFR